MHAGADIAGQLRQAALRRRAPCWLGAVLPWALLAVFSFSLLALAGLALAIAWCLWDARRLDARVRAGWSAWLDGTVPALEDSSALLAGATSALGQLQRRRLLLRVAQNLSPQVVASIAREKVGINAGWLLPGALLALALFAWQQPRASSMAPGAAAPALRAAGASELLLRVTPPRYTGAAKFESAPRELQVPEHSVVEWCLTKPQQGAAQAALQIELSDGQVLPLGAACARWSALESVFWRWRGVRYNLKVTPDQAPQISVMKPSEMTEVLAQDATSAAIALSVRDDYMVRRATLHLTLARGSGENIRFSDREMPIPESNDARSRNWNKQWTLAELGMEPGDELYFFVRAVDNAERPHTTVSPTYTLRLPGPVEEESEESAALPMLVKPENLRSQRQIIIDTEQLVADLKANPRLDAATVRARSEGIAADQAQLRRRYGQFLGEESSLFGGDDHDDHEGHGDHAGQGDKAMNMISQFGHMHDQAESATLFDEATKKVLRRALSAMWDAEKALRAITPKPALAPEYKALDAIKELQQADRIYLHKTAFAPPPIKEELRMTGDVVGTKSYQRQQGEADVPIPPEVAALIGALDAGGALPALWSRTAHDWIRERIVQDEQRLEAQRAVQDVTDGCLPCRPVLRAWLRGAIARAPVLLQAQGKAETPFTRALRKGAAP